MKKKETDWDKFFKGLCGKKKEITIAIDLEKTDIPGVWKAKGFNTLFFDKNGLSKVDILDERECIKGHCKDCESYFSAPKGYARSYCIMNEKFVDPTSYCDDFAQVIDTREKE